MHIAINAYFWNRPDTGSGQYTRQLVYNFNRYVSDLKITLVFPQTLAEDTPQDIPSSVNVVAKPIPTNNLGKVKWEQIDFPHICEQLKVDLAHVPYWGAPLHSPVPVVVTIHDIITLLVPEYHLTFSTRLYNALVIASARGCAHIITDSQASKNDICRHLGFLPENITAIPLAVDSNYTSEPNLLMDMTVINQYDLPDSYVFYLGGYTLHKNVTTLLLAYTYVIEALGDEYPLVLAGNKPTKVSEIFPDYDSYIKKLGIGEYVKWLGFIPEEHKPILYRTASSFVFPSQYEGFGLPPLEAMACGVPVVTTTLSSIPEVVGDASFAVDAKDEKKMAGAIIATLIQDELAQQMRQAGRKQAAKFSWKQTVLRTLDVYTQILEH